MFDDDAPERDRFKAIVAGLEDPEWVRLRRVVLLVGAVLFAGGGLLTAGLAGAGWWGLAAFASTFVPGLMVVTHVHHVRFRRRLS